MNALRLAVLSTALLAAPAIAARPVPLTIASHEVTTDPRTRTAHFAVQFKGAIPPLDFRNGFKFGISRDVNVEPYVPGGNPDVIVWTGEIAATGGLVVRDGPTDVALAVIPFRAAGATMSFDVPWALLGDPDGRFAYVLVVATPTSLDWRLGVADFRRPWAALAANASPTADRADVVAVSAARTSWGQLKAIYRAR